MLLTLGLSKASSIRALAIPGGLLLAFMIGLILLGPGRAVSNADWLTLAASGEAQWRPSPGQGEWRAMAMNGHIPDGAEIRTGADGNAVVAKDLDRIEIRAATRLVVAARGATKGKMEIDQVSGSASYTVENRPAGTFSVRTPYLVAVVKGTQFDVEIDAEKTGVSVKEGRVGVSDTRSGDSVDVTPGQRANSKADAAGIDVSGASSSHGGATPANTPAANGNAAGKNNGNGGGNSDSGGSGGGGSGGSDSDSGGSGGGGSDSGGSGGGGGSGGSGGGGGSGSGGGGGGGGSGSGGGGSGGGGSDSGGSGGGGGGKR